MSLVQGRTGTENRPGQFPTTTLPAQPNFHSTSPTLAKSKKSPVCHTKITHFFTSNRSAGPPGIAQVQAWPVCPCSCLIWKSMQTFEVSLCNVIRLFGFRDMDATAVIFSFCLLKRSMYKNSLTFPVFKLVAQKCLNTQNASLTRSP